MPGIIGPPSDPQVQGVAECLRARGVEPVVLDLSCVSPPGAMSLLEGVPAVGGLDVSAVARWYVRSLPLPLPFHPLDQQADSDPPATVDEIVSRADLAYAAGRERRSFLFSFVAALERAGARLINPPARFGQHFLKLDQLHALRQADVPIPSTLATNDPDAVVEFAERHRGRIVYKPLAGGGLCRRAGEEDLGPERLRLLAHAPVLFQEEVPGRNIRVYVVDGRVVASYEIVAEQLDYRGAECAVVPTALLQGEEDAARQAAGACDLSFTGIDIRRRPDDSFAGYLSATLPRCSRASSA
jgi:hypothetical protein